MFRLAFVVRSTQMLVEIYNKGLTLFYLLQFLATFPICPLDACLSVLLLLLCVTLKQQNMIVGENLCQGFKPWPGQFEAGACSSKQVPDSLAPKLMQNLRWFRSLRWCKANGFTSKCLFFMVQGTLNCPTRGFIEIFLKFGTLGLIYMVSLYINLIPTSCSLIAIRLCSDRQNTSSYHRTESPEREKLFPIFCFLTLTEDSYLSLLLFQ